MDMNVNECKFFLKECRQLNKKTDVYGWKQINENKSMWKNIYADENK